MPLFMDIHRLPEGVTLEMVRDAHFKDMEMQGKYGVNYRGYWYDSVNHTVACLAEGPSSDACEAVHRHAHGLVADAIIEVNSDSVSAFLGGVEIAPTGEAVLDSGTPDPGLRVVMMTELDNLAAVGSRHGDAAALAILECHDRVVRETIQKFGGREVRHFGDGMMVSFSSASAAVQCALEIQRACSAERVANAECPALRIGMAAGEPVAQHENLYGVAVEQARAIARVAKPGQILVSTAVRDLCAGKGLAFAPASEIRLPGLSDPITLASVGAAAADSAPAPSGNGAPAGAVDDQAQRLRRSISAQYDVERELGRGGMATVYLARDVRHDRRVAIKVLRPELAAVLGTQRFLQEIRVAAQLTHPHIVALYDSGEADGILYYVMPNLDGETLRARIERERQLAVEPAVEIARQVGAALDYAHRQGVIHRDIKPENILLHDDQPMVLDFGIALALTHAGGDRITEPGLSVGTPAYMSPEQAVGDRDVDARSDVYSLGCVVYEMLSGEPPFTAANVQALIAKIVMDPPSRLARLRPDVPAHIDTAVHRAIAKAPADRFATAAEFAAALATAS